LLRKLALFLSVSLFLMSALLPLKAAQASGCASAVSADVCYAPGAAVPSQVPAEKSCVSFMVSEATDLPKRQAGISSIFLAQTASSLAEITVSPNHRPPRV